MKKKAKTVLKMILAVILMLALTGCWNRRELNTLAIVMGIGIDKAAMPNQIELTTQIANAGKIQSPGKGGDGGGKPFFNVETTGTDIFSIMRQNTHKVSRKLYVGQNQLIIFGEDLAKEGIRNYLDLFFRDHEARMTVNILVAKGTAKEVLQVEPEFSVMPASHITQLLNMQGATSESPTLYAVDLFKSFTDKTGVILAPMIQAQSRNDLSVVNIAGSAVIKGDKLVGELDRKETRGTLWVTDKIKGGILAVKVDKGKAELEITHAKSKVTSEIGQDGTITIKVNITAKGNLGSQQGAENLAKFQNLPVLQREAEDEIKKEIQLAVKKAKTLDADIFGFHEDIYKHHEKQWKKIEPNWDEVFKKLKIDVQVSFQVMGSGKINRPAYPEGE